MAEDRASSACTPGRPGIQPDDFRFTSAVACRQGTDPAALSIPRLCWGRPLMLRTRGQARYGNGRLHALSPEPRKQSGHLC